MLQLVRNMEAVERDCCISGYHTYKETWDAAAGEDLKCQRKSNLKDRYTVDVSSDGTIVGCLRRRFPVCSLFI